MSEPDITRVEGSAVLHEQNVHVATAGETSQPDVGGGDRGPFP